MHSRFREAWGKASWIIPYNCTWTLYGNYVRLVGFHIYSLFSSSLSINLLTELAFGRDYTAIRPEIL